MLLAVCMSNVDFGLALARYLQYGTIRYNENALSISRE